MIRQFDVHGTERDLLALFSNHPEFPGPHPGGELLWAAWERLAAGPLPVVLMYATDDEDIPVADMVKLRGILEARAPGAHTEIVSVTGGHAFFARSHHLTQTFDRIGRLLHGDKYVSRLNESATGGGAAGL